MDEQSKPGSQGQSSVTESQEPALKQHQQVDEAGQPQDFNNIVPPSPDSFTSPQLPVAPSSLLSQKSQKILRIVIIALAAVIIVGGAGLVYAYIKTTTVEPCTASVTACSVAAALEKLPSNPESLVPSDQKGIIDTPSAVPKGSVIKVYPNSWVQVSPSSGTMHITLYSPWPIGTDYLVSMLEENGHWVIGITIPIQN